MLKRLFTACLVLCFTPLVFAEQSAFVEGQHYIELSKDVQQKPVLQALLREDPDKVQVLEFFNYQCPGCYAFEGAFVTWESQQGEDVAIYRVPVEFRPPWLASAKAYYALEELGQAHAFNEIIFNAIHQDGVTLETQAQYAVFLNDHGIDPVTFNNAYAGFGVDRHWKQAQRLREEVQANSIPMVIVNGQYMTHLGMTRDPVLMTQVMDYLVEKSRN